MGGVKGLERVEGVEDVEELKLLYLLDCITIESIMCDHDDIGQAVVVEVS